MTKKKAKKFPDTIYIAIHRENDGTEWFNADADFSGFAEINQTIPVAVYQLVGVQQVTTKAELE